MSDFELETFLPYLLTLAAERSSQAFTDVYRQRYGMLRTEWRVMFHLGLYGPMPARDIGQRSGLHKTKISRAVSALERKQMVGRDASDRDRRIKTLALTTYGQQVFDDLRQAAAGHDQLLLSKIAPTERQALYATLRKLAGK